MIQPSRLMRGGIFLAIVLALAGCGRRGPLEPPPGAPPEPTATAQPAETGSPAQLNSPPLPGQTPVTGSNTNQPPKGQSFFMDPMVK